MSHNAIIMVPKSIPSQNHSRFYPTSFRLKIAIGFWQQKDEIKKSACSF